MDLRGLHAVLKRPSEGTSKMAARAVRRYFPYLVISHGKERLIVMAGPQNARQQRWILGIHQPQRAPCDLPV